MINSSKIHFIGIGGIGVSAVARMMLYEGKQVSGSDMQSSALVGELESAGAKIFIGHSESNIEDGVDLVIYTVAIPVENPELMKAKERGITVMTYPEFLGELSKEKFTIAVSGTHGKTTTTGMIAKILIDAGLDPTVIIGSVLKDQKSNFVAGKGEILIVEACEYKRSFLNLSPSMLVITNIDEDHLDYYKDLEDIKSAFREMVGKLDMPHHVVTNMLEASCAEVVSETFAQVHDYSLESIDVDLQAPGKHNYQNAKAAFVVATLLGISKEQILNSLASFSGTWRRFDHKGEMPSGAPVYDDYAHHPTELHATLTAAAERFPGKKIIAVFQPHLYTRTKQHLDEFARCLSQIDSAIILPIYAAREARDESISSEMLSDKVVEYGGTSRVIEAFENVRSYLVEHADKNSVILTIGAGDIYQLAEMLVKS